jgi:hypothetical protein
LKKVDAVRSESEPAWCGGPMRITCFERERGGGGEPRRVQPRKKTHVYPQVVGDVLESAFETLDRSHHRFHVEADWEPFVKLVEEGFLCRGEGQRSEQLDEVAKVVATVWALAREGGQRAIIHDEPME